MVSAKVHRIAENGVHKAFPRPAKGECDVRIVYPAPVDRDEAELRRLLRRLGELLETGAGVG